MDFVSAHENFIPPLNEVKKFCSKFKAGNIIIIPDGFMAEELNQKGEQVALYKFDNKGELVEFDSKDLPNLINLLINQSEGGEHDLKKVYSQEKPSSLAIIPIKKE